MKRGRKRLLAGLLAFTAVCALGEFLSRSPTLPTPRHDGQGAVALVSAPIQKIGLFGRHTWLLLRASTELSFERWDLWQDASVRKNSWGHVHRNLMAPLAHVGAGGTRIEWVTEGAHLDAVIDCIRREAARYPSRDRYRAWPGPNSNTFVDAMLRGCGLPMPMSGTAVGKDWRGWIGASTTREQTGVQFESPLIGVSVGAREGIELRVFGLTIGVDVWPPAWIVPFGDGRFGF